MLLTTTGLGHFILANRTDLSLIIPPFIFLGATSFLTTVKLAVYMHQEDLATLANKMYALSTTLEHEFGSLSRGRNQGRGDEARREVLVLEIGSMGFAAIASTIPLALFVYQLTDPMNLYAFYVGPAWGGRLAYAVASSVFVYNQILFLVWMVLITFAPLCMVTYWLDELM